MVAYPVNWCENRLGDVCNYVNGTALEEYFSNYGNRRVISLGNYSEGGKYIDDGNRINLNQKTQSFLLYKDDLSMVLNDKGNGRLVGKVLLIESDDKYIFNQRSLRIIPNKNEAIPLFLYYLINSDIFRDSLKPHIQGNTQVYINPPAVMSIPIVLPPIVEQQVIASVLSDFDEHIDNLTKLIEKKKAIREGALEDLISGRTRIDGFDSDWKEVELGEISKLQDGTHGTFRRTNEGHYLLSAKNVFNNKLIITENESKVSDYDFEQITANGFPKIGDILLSCVGTIGRCCICDVDGLAFQRSVAFIRSHIVNNLFLLYVLQGVSVQTQLLSSMNASAQGGIYLGALKKIVLRLPVDVKEQEAIAQIIKAMDEEIEALEIEMEKIIQIREGAMDDLLTGRVRLKI